MQVKKIDLNKIQLKIREAIIKISNNRKDDKNYYINAFAISKQAGISWKTADKYLRKGIIF